MAIGHFIKEIGRGKDGARDLSQAQAADLWGQVLDGKASDLEIGAFCVAMRIKGETPEEMSGFLDATEQRLTKVQTIPTHQHRMPVVIPSYNGARKLPVLTPLLALLLAREGFPVLLHGTPTEDGRVCASEVLSELGVAAQDTLAPLQAGHVAFYPTGLLLPGLQRLLDVRRAIRLRNPAHSLVKLMQVCDGPELLVTSYTHPEYARAMEAVLCRRNARALLLRGTEGEAIADPRRTPRMTHIAPGQMPIVSEQQTGSLGAVPELPASDARSTARFIRAVLDGEAPLPEPIATQLAHIVALAQNTQPMPQT